MGKLISFIIPVYNGENYIKNCIEGVLAQTLLRSKYEAIFIDDGSKDTSLKILREYEAENQDIIRVYTQENHGAGEARNHGIELATGKFVVPIDCDDIIKEDYAMTLLKAVTEANADYAISGYNTVNEDLQRLSTVIPKEEYFTRFKVTLTCGKIYSRSFLMRNNIHYSHAYIMEDPHFNIICAMKARTVRVINYVGYDVIMKPKVKGQLTSSAMIRDNNPYVLEMIEGFIANHQDFAISQPLLFKYILAKFAYNNFLANRLKYKDARAGLDKQLHIIKEKGYTIKVRELLFTLQGESISTKVIIGFCIFALHARILKPFYMIYLKTIR